MGCTLPRAAHGLSDEDDESGDRKIEISISRAILTMSRYLPWECECLAQAISGKMMLRRRQIPSTLYLGVAKKEDGDLNAHAWLLVGEIIILGGFGLKEYAIVSTFT